MCANTHILNTYIYANDLMFGTNLNRFSKFIIKANYAIDHKVCNELP